MTVSNGRQPAHPSPPTHRPVCLRRAAAALRNSNSADRQCRPCMLAILPLQPPGSGCGPVPLPQPSPGFCPQRTHGQGKGCRGRARLKLLPALGSPQPRPRFGSVKQLLVTTSARQGYHPASPSALAAATTDTANTEQGGVNLRRSDEQSCGLGFRLTGNGCFARSLSTPSCKIIRSRWLAWRMGRLVPPVSTEGVGGHRGLPGDSNGIVVFLLLHMPCGHGAGASGAAHLLRNASRDGPLPAKWVRETTCPRMLNPQRAAPTLSCLVPAPLCPGVAPLLALRPPG